MAPTRGKRRALVKLPLRLKLALYFSVCSGVLLARDPSWFLDRMKLIESIEGLPTEERFDQLGRLVAIGHRPPLDQEQGTVFRAAQKELLALPGHADYFGRKIRNDRKLFASGRRNEIQGGPNSDFGTLGQLPSAETVRVLGTFLNDGPTEDSPDPFNSSSDLAKPMANNLLAARALHELKIVNPPLKKQPGSYADVHPWRLWFSQVEAGTRSFRFHGDPQSYGLSGPLSKEQEHRLADQTPGVPRGEPQSTDNRATVIDNHPRFPLVPLVASSVLLAMAIWFGILRRKAGRIN